MAEPENKDTAPLDPEAPDGQFAIHKVYTKDISFETPNSPDIFRVDWRPELDVQLFTNTSRLDVALYEVTLRITVTVKIEEKTAFLAEVNQAGIFGSDEPQEERLKYILGSFCPNILFPYARETVSDLVSRGGFPQFLLAPVNFDAIYAKHLQETQGNDDSQAADAGT
uniref:Protein-export protein SecB n=1 Tax=Candidatus Kentrum sp. MB TaxID=2138164 RepID=A0A451B9E0_9GAMM|nr:MAG: protein translocase subunit secB [Candidatus Kentron sp. MB]VFK29718.1 MAG: protein translocase subunit secB [Candidatus Kentron sp. MB]VFK74882.1 MAG: protein translocase subunit secB [Candidatus Kentron sp. MB]